MLLEHVSSENRSAMNVQPQGSARKGALFGSALSAASELRRLPVPLASFKELLM